MLTTPQTLNSAAAWKGATFDFRRHALRQLAPQHLLEIETGLAAYEVEDRGDLLDITAQSFPLPTVAPFMRGLLEELRHGAGVILLRGLDRSRYSEDQISKIYFALGTHLGMAVPQSFHGELLGSVIDVSDAEPGVRGYQAGGRQNFHSDGTACDVVGLMCLRAARKGGESRLVSAVAVHNALIERDPRLAQVFYDGFIYRKMDNDAKHAGQHPTVPYPVEVFAQRDGEFFANLNGGDIRRAVDRGDTTLTELQTEAYDLFQKIANSEEFYLDMAIGEGDIQFVNNRTILHGRLGYEDEEEVARRRHMLRQWLEVPGWPKRPDHQVVMSFETARRWLANRDPRMEMPTHFVAVKQQELADRRSRGEDAVRLRPYEDKGLRGFVAGVRNAGA
jgi:hypothetical protein